MTGRDYEFEDLYLDALLENVENDIPPVFHIWWTANSVFPHKPLSERLSLAERVVRRLLDEGLVDLVRSPKDESPIAQGKWNDILRRYLTWVAPEAVSMYLRITDLGRERVRDMSRDGYSAWRHLDGEVGTSPP